MWLPIMQHMHSIYCIPLPLLKCECVCLCVFVCLCVCVCARVCARACVCFSGELQTWWSQNIFWTVWTIQSFLIPSLYFFYNILAVHFSTTLNLNLLQTEVIKLLMPDTNWAVEEKSIDFIECVWKWTLMKWSQCIKRCIICTSNKLIYNYDILSLL